MSTRWLLLLPSILISTASAAAIVDVLVVFSDDSALSGFEKTTVAARYQQALSNVYDDQLDGNRTVEVSVLASPEMSYRGYNKALLEGVSWMVNQNAISTSPLRVARDSFGPEGADLVLMVVPFTSSTGCGATTAIPRVASTGRSESSAFAVIVLEDNNPGCLEEFVVPHEVGHLLYAEHETDTNGDELLPDYRNHAIRSNTSSLVSLMWRTLTSNATNQLSGSRWDMTSLRSNNVAFMSSESFDVVSRYRALPGPTSASALFLGCHQPGCALWRFEFSASNATRYRIQSSPYAFGPWSTWKVTSSNTYFPHLAQNPRYWRIRGENW